MTLVLVEDLMSRSRTTAIHSYTCSKVHRKMVNRFNLFYLHSLEITALFNAYYMLDHIIVFFVEI